MLAMVYLAELSENPVDLKKRINTELCIHVRAEVYIQKWGANFLANLTRVKVGAKTNNWWQ